MFSQGYYITAELKVKDRANIRTAFESLQHLCEQTLQEPGCSIFQLHRCLHDETRFLLWERYDSEEDYHAHFQQPHTQAYLKRDLTEIVQHFASDVPEGRGNLSNATASSFG
ncbi:carboxymuconolactone decarboxylase [Photobacterium galatheae]|uniref:Carboxymuconolactone decarboxylase n=2 Tax=Photobacterium galatheae TaxID=1654360 RepID=A0A066RHF6_9GAMM|nr:carboxymuconolactone decarboxylase [Photobacterium galatheae]